MQILQEQISVHAVEKKVTKEKATQLPLTSCAPRFYRGSAEGAPAPLLTRGKREKYHPCITSHQLLISFHAVLEIRRNEMPAF